MAGLGMNVRGIARAINEQRKSPCERGCELRSTCAVQEISCLSFNRYAESGILTYRIPTDMPSREIFERQQTDAPDLVTFEQHRALSLAYYSEMRKAILP